MMRDQCQRFLERKPRKPERDLSKVEVFEIIPARGESTFAQFEKRMGISASTVHRIELERERHHRHAGAHHGPAEDHDGGELRRFQEMIIGPDKASGASSSHGVINWSPD
jgi:hypothetical protein